MERVIPGLLCVAAMLMFALAPPVMASDDDLEADIDEDIDADEQPFYFEGGTYFSVGISYLVEDFTRTVGKKSTDKGFRRVEGNVKNAEGINAVFGKRAFGYAAIEMQFEFSDGFQFDDRDGEHFDLKVYTTTFNLKLLPFHALLRNFNEGRLQPHVLVGGGLMVNRDLDIDTGASAAMRLGGGFDYFVNEKWALNLKSSYVLPFGQLRGLRYTTTSLGLTYQLN